MINEENITEKILELKNKSLSWSEIFKQIKNQTKVTEKYASIKYNYTSLFVLEMMKQKIDINDFNETIIYIYNNTTKLDGFFSRFFDHNADVTLTQYLQEDRDNYQGSVWDNLSLYFLDKKDGKVIFNQEKLKYLKSILFNMTEERVGDLHNGKFTWYCTSFLRNFDELIPIFEITESNTAYSKSVPRIHYAFFEGLINHVGHYSYEETPEVNQHIYKVLKENIENIDEKLAQVLLRGSDFSEREKVKIDFGVLNFLTVCNVNIIPLINNKYKELFNEYRKTSYHEEYDSHEAFSNIIHLFDTSLKIGYQDSSSPLDLNLIDIQDEIRANWLILKILEVEVQKGNYINISKEVADYLRHNLKEKNKDLFDKDNYFLDEPLLLKYSQYAELNSKVLEKEDNKNNQSKFKI